MGEVGVDRSVDTLSDIVSVPKVVTRSVAGPRNRRGDRLTALGPDKGLNDLPGAGLPHHPRARQEMRTHFRGR